MPADKHVSRLVTLMAAVLTALGVLLPPIIYFGLSYQREAGGVEAEAELNSQLITQVVSGNPDMWRYEQVRLSEYLARRPRGAHPEGRRVVDLDGAVIAENADPLAAPLVTRSVPLLDAGTRVGFVEISRSLQPILLQSGFLAIVLLPVAFLAFQVLRTVPLRAVRRSQRALRRQRDTAQKYLDVAGVAVLLLDAEGRVSLVNRKGTEVLSRGEHEIVGKEWISTFVDPPDRARAAEVLAALAHPEQIVQEEYAVLRPSGERRVISWYLTSIVDRESGQRTLLASGVDITTQRQLEEALRQAQKMEAIGALAGGVAHGFNNILSTIKGYASLLRKELPPDDAHRADVDEILGAADRAAALTRSLLTFSRHGLVEPAPADLGEIVRRMERLLRSVLRDEVELQIEASPDPLPVQVDAVQIEQVLLNLVTNARDAMPRGGSISIVLARESLNGEGARRAGLARPGDYARVAVTDSGVGIDPAIQERVFEPFFSTKDVDKGTGLGLAIAYGVMKKHQGTIRLESEPGRGATFTLYLPLVARPAASASPAAGGAEVPVEAAAVAAGSRE